MPNDPRVKFHKGGKICRKDIEYLRKHPECYGFIKHNGAFGSGSQRGDGQGLAGDTPRPPGGGEPPIQIDIPTGRDTTEIIPQPLKPSLNPGEITGITIGSIAGAAALAELTRRTLEEQRRRRGGEQPVSQDDRPLSSRQSGGQRLERQSRARVGRAISRGINTAVQSSFEMMTPSSTRPVGPIQADFAPLSIESSPSTSGTSTPSLQSARSRSSSGTTTPAKGTPLQPQETASGAAPRPTPEHQRIVAGGPRIGTADNVIMREPIHKSLLSSTPLDNDPNRLSTIFTSPEGTIGKIEASSITKPPPPPIRKPDVALDLQKELEMRQIEIQNPNISEARTKTLQSEIRVLERQIKASGGSITPIEDRIRAAINTSIPNPATAPAPPPAPAPVITESGTITPPELIDEATSLLSRLSDRNLTAAERDTIGARLLEVENRIAANQSQARKSQTLVNDTMAEILAANPTASIDTLNLAVAAANVDILQKSATEATAIRKEAMKLKAEARQAVIKARQAVIEARKAANKAKADAKISRKVQPTNVVGNNPANDRINASRQTSNIEMQSLEAHEQRMQTIAETLLADTPVPADPAAIAERNQLVSPGETAVKPRGPATIEETRASMQTMGSRKPVPSNQAALERARAASARASEVEIRPVVQQPRESTGRLSNEAYRQLLEGLPEDEIVDMMRLREQLNLVTEGTPPEPIERPAAEVPKLPPPQERAPVVATETAVDRFNKIFDYMTAEHIDAGFEIPTAPEGMTGIERQKYIMDEIIKETIANDYNILSGKDNKIITPEEAFARVQKNYDNALNDPTTRRPVEATLPEEQIGISATKKGKGKGKLTKKTQLLATEEQRLRPAALAGEAQARVRAAAPAEVRATAPVETARAPVMETATARAAAASELRAPTAPAPETLSARRQLSAAPEAGRPVAPGERASVTEKINFFEQKPVAPPTETPTPSAPPSAPESEISTPREGAVMERTPAERAAFAEEVKLGLSKKPGRQKVKINVGQTNKATRNPLDIFVNPQFRNTPNLEIHPSAKNLRGALSELSARVPKLVPSKKVLISVGTNLASEGGGMVAGFYAGSEAGKAMSNYFATHPPKNRGEEYGQALATSMVALGVGNLVSKAVTYAIRQGVRIAMGAQISGSISGAGTAGFSAVAEAALFATVATTTQFYVTKSLEDAGRSHAYSRAMGAFAATEALIYTDIAMWLAKGGPVNPAGDLSFIASELFIIGFGIYSVFEEYAEGRKQDIEGEAYDAEARAERARAEQERRDTIDALNRTNNAKAIFLRRLPMYNYDFDALYERLTEQEKTDLGITTPESKRAFQNQVERTFDPFSSFEKSESGLQEQPVLTQVEKDRAEVMNNYINYHIRDLQGQQQPPFNFDDPKVRELNEYSGGTWQSAARVSASTSYLQSQQVYPLISKAQNEIIDAFHNERKTIEQMDPLTVRYATLDSTFRENYEAYIVTDAAAQILMEFNRTQYTYNDVDPALLAIADRDPNFRAAADMYYQVLANQARDYNLSISEVARLNSLMETEQAIEIGKLNDARNAIINKNQAENQAMVDAYNANILREINIYGDNFDAIIRNINDQSLLSGHTFLYATNRADLYRQLHLEVPEVEFVDPPDEVDRPDATWHPGKGRKVGDTAVYGYRYNLTDEQNQEIEDLISANKISRFDAEKQALIIYNRDRAKFVQTDQEKAADLGLTLDAYYKKFGIVEPTIISSELTYEQLQTLYPDQYRDLQQKYKNDPDADKKIEETLARGHKRRMDETGGVYTPMEQEDLTFEQLQQMYPSDYDKYVNLFTNNGRLPLTPENTKYIEIMLRDTHKNATNAGTAPPVPQPTREPTYEELQVMYPEQFTIYNDANSAIGQEDKTEMMLRRLHARRVQAGTAPNIPGLGEEAPVNNELKNGVVNMPDGSTRIYKNGLVVNVMYPMDNRNITDFKNAQEINAAEGQQNADYVPTKGPATTLRQGAVTMPDGSKRFYVDGKVVSVDYPEGKTGPTIKEINSSEGVNSVPINQATNPGGLPTQIETPTGGTLPFVPGARSFEYADSGTQAKPATQRPGLDVVPEFTSGSRSHEYMNPAPAPAPAPASTTTNP